MHIYAKDVNLRRNMNNRISASISCKRLGGLHCWRRLCRQKVTVWALTPFDRIEPMGNCGTPRIGNASEDWQRLR